MKIVIINCGKVKRNIVTTANNMYIGKLFQKSYNYAKSLNPDKIFILSAKYGLLEENEVIAPYDMTLKGKSIKEVKEWSNMVLNQFKEKNIDINTDEFVFLTSKSYIKYILPYVKNYIYPIEHLRVGFRMKFFTEETNKNKESLCII